MSHQRKMLHRNGGSGNTNRGGGGGGSGGQVHTRSTALHATKKEQSRGQTALSDQPTQSVPVQQSQDSASRKSNMKPLSQEPPNKRAPYETELHYYATNYHHPKLDQRYQGHHQMVPPQYAPQNYPYYNYVIHTYQNMYPPQSGMHATVPNSQIVFDDQPNVLPGLHADSSQSYYEKMHPTHMLVPTKQSAGYSGSAAMPKGPIYSKMPPPPSSAPRYGTAHLGEPPAFVKPSTKFTPAPKRPLRFVDPNTKTYVSIDDDAQPASKPSEPPASASVPKSSAGVCVFEIDEGGEEIGLAPPITRKKLIIKRSGTYSEPPSHDPLVADAGGDAVPQQTAEGARPRSPETRSEEAPSQTAAEPTLAERLETESAETEHVATLEEKPEEAPEEEKREATPGEVVREAAPEEEKREAAPEEVVREAMPEEVAREAMPEEVVREAAPEEVVREAAPEEVAREAMPEEVVREAAPEGGVSEDAASSEGYGDAKSAPADVAIPGGEVMSPRKESEEDITEGQDTKAEDFAESSREEAADSGRSSIDEGEDEERGFEIVYPPDTWSPSNPTGKKIYDRDFIMQFQHLVKIIPSIQIPEEISQSNSSRGGYGGGHRDGFFGGSRGRYYTRPFQDKVPSGREGKNVQDSRGRANRERESVRSGSKDGFAGKKGRSGTRQQDHRSGASGGYSSTPKDRWSKTRPYQASNDADELEQSTRLFRGILNRIAPDSFDMLTEKICDNQVTNIETLVKLVDIITEKALIETKFSSLYAKLCKELNAKLPPLKNHLGEEQTLCRSILNKCQYEFELRVPPTPIPDSIVDPEQRLDMELAEAKRHDKIMGLIRFIGELFNEKVLKRFAIHICIKSLLSTITEDNLEQLCLLLTTTGANLATYENNTVAEGAIAKFKEIINSNDIQISSRIRCLIQDVVDLSENQWKLRGAAANVMVPMKLSEVHKDIERKAREKEQQLFLDRKQTSGKFSSRPAPVISSPHQGLSNASSKHRQHGNSILAGSSSSRNSFKSLSPAAQIPPNRQAAPASQSGGGRQYPSRPSSKTSDISPSSASTKKINMFASLCEEEEVELPERQPPLSADTAEAAPIDHSEEMDDLIKEFIEEGQPLDFIKSVQEFPPNKLPDFICQLVVQTLEKSKEQVCQWAAEALSLLLKQVHAEKILDGLTQFFHNQLSDIKVDVPKADIFAACIITPLVQDQCLTMKDIDHFLEPHKSNKPLILNFFGTFWSTLSKRDIARARQILKQNEFRLEKWFPDRHEFIDKYQLTELFEMT
ncbi:eukaryotic translation initiation factor 4 gamma 3-like [Schistocerca gregaria]|uniref:eukaryotic translation initiation factor 4 gamma 3-like n=1 Tax=Schistocerca gregaria TaxID=7010 RepID=UPI00211E99AE|nr:eukaryotic translation initiation factor 4 gamma 3-like [Schistocerca gregaria]